MIAGLVDPDEIGRLWQRRRQLLTVQTHRNGPLGHYLKHATYFAPLAHSNALCNYHCNAPARTYSERYR
eukprot:scaffold27542_cov33-Attheya_sp.AAC.4